MTDYLSARHLRGVVSGHDSYVFPITAGVPQRSILGPTLFLLYVNASDTTLGEGEDLAVYADDTTLYQCVAVRADVNDRSRVLQHAVDDLSAWGKAWKISFEPTKSQALTIDHHRPRRQLPAISFDGIPVVEEAELKLLGVQFDTQLYFHQHLRFVAVRARQRLHFLNRAAPPPSLMFVEESESTKASSDQ